MVGPRNDKPARPALTEREKVEAKLAKAEEEVLRLRCSSVRRRGEVGSGASAEWVAQEHADHEQQQRQQQPGRDATSTLVPTHAGHATTNDLASQREMVEGQSPDSVAGGGAAAGGGAVVRTAGTTCLAITSRTTHWALVRSRATDLATV